MVSGGGFTLRIHSCWATVGFIVSGVSDTDRIIWVSGDVEAHILLRVRVAAIPFCYLITQAGQQVPRRSVDGQVGKMSNHHRLAVW